MPSQRTFANEKQGYSTNDKAFWQALIALTVASIMTFSNIYMIQPILPLFSRQFDVSPTASSLLVSLTILSLIIGLLFFGLISDRWGRGWLMKATILGSMLPLLAMIFAQSFSQLLVLRFIQGFFVAGLPAAAIAYIGEEFEERSVRIGIAFYIASNAVGGMFGRVFVGYLTDVTSWQTALGLLFGIEVIFFVAFMSLLPKSRNFVTSELPIKEDLTMMFIHLKNKNLIPAFYMGVVIQLIFTGIWTYLPFYLNGEPFTLTIGSITLAYFAYGLGMLSSPIASKLSLSFGIDKIVTINVCLMFIGLMMTAVPSVTVIYLGLGILCLGFFVVHSMIASCVNQQARHHKGGASSLYLVSYYIGVAGGGTLTGFLWDFLGWYGVLILSLLIIPGLIWGKSTYLKAS
ncbi:MFS transporter [Thalassobacillus pellis]|uniref:MFS transporter n=1 Tax=Thalassobacillus pellis TaxID=748008 RepID=UPI00195F6B00|nr:MFS transporter [Thalassobacillus pellis]MBM7553608.1 YNFM family putative membrane transporter [Thalassobacillus pellis]